jgi:hypothetical protein
MPNQEDKPFQWHEKYTEVIEKGAAYTKTLVVGPSDCCLELSLILPRSCLLSFV